MARFSGLETITSMGAFMAPSTRAISMHCSLPSLISPRLASRTGLSRMVPAFAWRMRKRIMGIDPAGPEVLPCSLEANFNRFVTFAARSPIGALSARPQMRPLSRRPELGDKQAAQKAAALAQGEARGAQGGGVIGQIANGESSEQRESAIEQPDHRPRHPSAKCSFRDREFRNDPQARRR